MGWYGNTTCAFIYRREFLTPVVLFLCPRESCSQNIRKVNPLPTLVVFNTTRIYETVVGSASSPTLGPSPTGSSHLGCVGTVRIGY